MQPDAVRPPWPVPWMQGIGRRAGLAAVVAAAEVVRDVEVVVRRGDLLVRMGLGGYFWPFYPSMRPNPHGCRTTCHFSIRPRTPHGRMQNRQLVPIPRAYGRMDG